MGMHRVPSMLGMLVLSTARGSAVAQSLRCKDDLASVGDNKAAVALKCGEPVAKSTYCKPVPAGMAPTTGSVPCDEAEEWSDRPGSGQLMTTLKFESNRLRSIEYGDRIR